MELHQLRYFVAAAEAGNISRAAERCRVAQPSLSQQLHKLEAEVGAALFDRLGRGVSLTDAGRALLPRARRVLAEVRDIEDRLLGDVAQGGGRLAIGAIPTMAPYLLPALLRRLRAAFPRCELVIVEDLTENLVEQLVDNRLDVAVLSTPVEDPRVTLEIVGDEPLLVVAPAGSDLEAAGAGGVSMEQLREQPIITLHPMHCLGRQISGFCAARSLGQRVVCQTAQLATVLEFVAQGLGISLAPRMAAEHDRGEGREGKRGREYFRGHFRGHFRGRVYLDIKRAPFRRDIALAWRRDRTPGVASRELARLLREDLADR